jgi:hypothetical protein
VDSLIDSEEKKSFVVNQLLYSRITIYRALRDKGVDLKGEDPFQHLGQAADQLPRLAALFPALFPNGSLAVPMWPGAALFDGKDGEAAPDPGGA